MCCGYGLRASVAQISVGIGGQLWSVLSRFCCFVNAAEATVSPVWRGNPIFAALVSGFGALGLFGLPGKVVSSSRSLADLRTTLTTRCFLVSLKAVLVLRLRVGRRTNPLGFCRCHFSLLLGPTDLPALLNIETGFF